MNDFTYSLIRSFNQYINGSNHLAMGTDEQLILNPKPGHKDLDRDTISVEFYDSLSEDYFGRSVGTTTGRKVNLWCQVDVLSPPNNSGEPRAGACRKLKDKYEQVWKSTLRFPVLLWDGTGGTAIERYAYIRQLSAAPRPMDDMEGWSGWRLDYKLWCIDTG